MHRVFSVPDFRRQSYLWPLFHQIMKILGIIPARYASTRLPAKALADIGGKTMVRRVYEQAIQASAIREVWVATDHPLIEQEVKSFGGNVLMTSADHLNGTERCREAYDLLAKDFDYVINIQGDEPFIDPRQLDELAALLNGQVELATLVSKVKSAEDLFNPSVMKVVMDRQQNAMYFSRECIPHLRGIPAEAWLAKGAHYKHVCIYAYRQDVLHAITKLPLSPLEAAESLEQLRWLEHGYQMKVGITEFGSLSVDTAEDLEKARKRAE